MGKTTRTMLNLVASAIENTSYYNHQLSEFLSKLPAIKARGPKVQEHMRTLIALQFEANTDCLLVLDGVVKEVPSLVMSLRARACEQLLKVVRNAIDRAWSMIQEHQQTVALKNLISQFVQVLENSSDIFVADAGLESYLGQAADMLERCGADALLQDVHVACKACLAAEGKTSKEVTTQVQELMEKLSGISLPKSAFAVSALEDMRALVTKLSTAMVTHYSSDMSDFSGMRVWANGAQLVSEMMGEEPFLRRAACMQSAVALLENSAKLKGHLAKGEEAADQILFQCTQMTRTLSKLQQFPHELGEASAFGKLLSRLEQIAKSQLKAPDSACSGLIMPTKHLASKPPKPPNKKKKGGPSGGLGNV